MAKTENIIVDLSFQFALKIIELTSILDSLNKKPISFQLLKSGTSIGANIHESQHAESRADFIHKLKIAAKEANETEYWLRLIYEGKIIPKDDKLLDHLNHIQRILSIIISKSKDKL
ncbi:MAG TPA: four helix bundle protein [Bacteroidales bacterium]|mgnify:CR=1 FL=1|jgi:four helix bundle protein|nr:four helix bundle protein [Bacteroidales bacterium]HPE39605.1 four helix bundle protein [Bacteroidales bacterium]